MAVVLSLASSLKSISLLLWIVDFVLCGCLSFRDGSIPSSRSHVCLGLAQFQRTAVVVLQGRHIPLSQCRVNEIPADGLGPGCAARLAPPKPLLGERDKVFPSLLFWLDLSGCFPFGKNVNKRRVLCCCRWW